MPVISIDELEKNTPSKNIVSIDELEKLSNKSSVQPEDNKFSFRKDIIGPFTGATSALAFDIPRTAMKMQINAGTPGAQQAYDFLYPEQQSKFGKFLRFGAEAPATLFGGAGTIAGKTALKLAPLATKSFLGKVGQAAATGGTFGALTAKPTFEEYEKNIAGNTAFGAAIPFSASVLRNTGDFFNRIGDKILQTELGQRLTEYGKEKGFENIKQYITKEVPRSIVTRINQFFPKAIENAGQKVSKIINSKKYENIFIGRDQLQQEANNILPKDVFIKDLDISNAEGKILNTLTNKVLLLDKEKINIPELWNLRRELDKVVYSRNITKPDAVNYINKLRTVLNNPIRSSGSDVAKAFDRYSFIKQAEDELGEKFLAINDKSKGNIYSQQISDFISQNFVGKDKSETINLLKDIEHNISKPDKVIDEMLNFGAAQQLEKPSEGWGGIYKFLLDLSLGGKKGVVNKAVKIQKIQKKFGEFGQKLEGIGQKIGEYYKSPFIDPRSFQGVNPINLKGKGGFASFRSIVSTKSSEETSPSRIKNLIASNPQNIWTPQQLKGYLQGKVSQNEIDTLLTSDLMSSPKITKSDIFQSIEKNMPQIEIVRKGQRISKLPEFIDYKGEKISNIGSIQLGIRFQPEVNQYQGSILTNHRFNYVWGNTESQVKTKMIKILNERFTDLMKSQELTKFSQFQIPGGTNYQETLIKAPKIDDSQKEIFRKQADKLRTKILDMGKRIGVPKVYDNSEYKILEKQWYEAHFKANKVEDANIKGHFDEPNVLVHIRHNDRVTTQGEKVRFLEEIQSDWSKKGRQSGFIEETNKLYPEADRIIGGKTSSPVPFHPLLKNWQELSLKQALKDAVDSDAKYLSWTTGNQQAARYDLSKQINELVYDPKTKEILVVKKGEDTYTSLAKNVQPQEIDEYIGKGIGDKLLNSEKLPNGWHKLSGLDLKIGGEWAINLYDKQIPNILKKLTGQDVEMIKIKQPATKNIDFKSEFYKPERELIEPAIRLTPELKAQIKSGKGKIGELFSLAALGMAGTLSVPEKAQAFDADKKKQIAVVEQSGKTTGDYAQLEDIVLKDLKQLNKIDKSITLEQVKKDPELYDKIVELYWKRLDDFGIPENKKALWWLMPGRYKKTGGDINKIFDSKLKYIMHNREKRLKESGF